MNMRYVAASSEMKQADEQAAEDVRNYTQLETDSRTKFRLPRTKSSLRLSKLMMVSFQVVRTERS